MNMNTNFSHLKHVKQNVQSDLFIKQTCKRKSTNKQNMLTQGTHVTTNKTQLYVDRNNYNNEQEHIKHLNNDPT